jgi:hypothetical protein
MKTNPKPFTGREKPYNLSPDEAKESVRRYHCNRKKNDIKAHYFGEVAIAKLLKTPGAVGIRVYYALNEKNDMEAFLVAVNAQGENLFKGEYSHKGDKDYVTEDTGIISSPVPCPNRCPPPSSSFE